jgi:ferrous iron transport protein B
MVRPIRVNAVSQPATQSQSHVQPVSTAADIVVALVGNPNTGKSTLFSALAGVRQRTGNYPGVTVEKKLGRMRIDGRNVTLIDLPGTYSLAPRSADEMVAVDVLLGRQPDVPEPHAVVCIVDASNLQRNLFLVSQVLELGRPTVVALNMCDLAASKGIEIDVEELSSRLGVPVIKTQAHRKRGMDDLSRAILAAASEVPPPRLRPMPPPFQAEVDALSAELANANAKPVPRYLVERILLDTSGYLNDVLGVERNGFAEKLTAARSRLADAGLPVPAVEAMARYGWIGTVLDGVVTQGPARPRTWSDRLDRILTHRVWGTALFVLVMLLVFQAVFAWAVPLMDLIDAGTTWLGGLVGGMLAEGPLQSLLVNGVIGGVGSVIIFLPQIFFLFFFLAILEDCGYMARAAYLMDKLMSRVGLSGKSFIPLLSSFACAVPGIMATRVIENRRDRMVTILVAPLMSCSARLPVYILLIGAFIPSVMLFGFEFSLPSFELHGRRYFAEPFHVGLGLKGLTMFAMYMVGILVAIPVAWLLRKTFFRGPASAFVLELPSYKFPSARVVLWRMLERGWAFVRRAGTLILAVTIVVWAAGYFPRNPEVTAQVEAEYADELPPEMVEARVQGAQLQQSVLGRAGQWIEPVVEPLGWDWRIGCAAIASFPAREVIIGTLGVIYNLGDAEDETSTSLREQLKNARWDDDPSRPVFTIPVALSVMVFFALCAQCASTLVIMGRETRSWRWPIFAFVYMTVLAYGGAWITYQAGTWIMS